MSTDRTERIKQLTLVALFSDDELVNALVLKGGNALSLAHGLKSRASFDLDFSMAGRFEPTNLDRIRARIEHRLKQTFAQEELVAFDIDLRPQPQTLSPDLEAFWGGYALEFKLIERTQYDDLQGDVEKMRRRAIAARPGGKARFEIDISPNEYCEGKQTIEIDHFTIYVYTPVMVVCEKIRAICQQTPEYSKLVRRQPRVRARDFFDVFEAMTRFDITLDAAENQEILRRMFEAKRVPLHLLGKLGGQRAFHQEGWDSLKDTVASGVKLKDFDFYFDFVLRICDCLVQKMGVNPLGT